MIILEIQQAIPVRVTVDTKGFENLSVTVLSSATPTKQTRLVFAIPAS